MMKKAIFILFTLILAITITGCGSTEEKQSNKENQEQKEGNNQQNNSNNNTYIDDEIIEFDDEDNKPVEGGRITVEEFEKGTAEIFDLDEGASYAQRVGGNFGADYVPVE